ncbi:MAG: hypothetical protein ABI379_00325 [Rhodanobacter sp.]
MHVVPPLNRAEQGLILRQALQFKTTDDPVRTAGLPADKLAGIVTNGMAFDDEAGECGTPQVPCGSGTFTTFERLRAHPNRRPD